jgi:integrase
LPPAIEALALFRFTSQRDRNWSDRALRRGLTLIPIEMAHYGLCVAHAILRSGMVTGARICETLQQAASEHCFRVTREGDFYFEAVPKGGAGLGPGLCRRERFYCDASTLEAILEVIDVGRRNGGTCAPIAPARRLRDRCPVDAYIYRIRDRVIRDTVANASLRVLLFGRALASHDLRHAFAKVGDKNGPRRGVQAALHHAWPSTTEHYATPTLRDQAELARRIATLIRPHKPRGGK